MNNRKMSFPVVKLSVLVQKCEKLKKINASNLSKGKSGKLCYYFGGLADPSIYG